MSAGTGIPTRKFWRGCASWWTISSVSLRKLDFNGRRMKPLWKVVLMLCITGVPADLAFGQDKEPREKQIQPADIVTVVVNPKEAKEIRKLLDLLPETP